MKSRVYTVKVEENGVVPIPEPLLKKCPWIKTHIIDVIKVTEADGSWKLILKPGKKLNARKGKVAVRGSKHKHAAKANSSVVKGTVRSKAKRSLR